MRKAVSFVQLAGFFFVPGQVEQTTRLVTADNYRVFHTELGLEVEYDDSVYFVPMSTISYLEYKPDVRPKPGPPVVAPRKRGRPRKVPVRRSGQGGQ